MTILKPLANTITFDLAVKHIKVTFAASCLCFWSTGLTGEKTYAIYCRHQNVCQQAQIQRLPIFFWNIALCGGTEFNVSKRKDHISFTVIINQKSEKTYKFEFKIGTSRVGFLSAKGIAMVAMQIFWFSIRFKWLRLINVSSDLTNFSSEVVPVE